MRNDSPHLLHSGCSGWNISEREFQFYVRILFGIDFNIRIDKVIQSIALLRGIQFQVPPQRELDSISVMRTKKIILLLGMLPGFRDIDRNPTVFRIEKFGPAVVAGD